MCVLNGRNSLKNDYTFVSAQGGCSVIDYCFAAYEDLDLFTNFEVHRIRNLIQKVFVEGSAASGHMPDLSFLTWVYMLPDEISQGENTSNDNSSYVRYNLKSIPSDFLLDPSIFSVLNARIDTLQTEQDNQLHMDGLFGDFCKTMKDEMNRYLNPKRILTGCTVRNKSRRTKKPWWCDDLTHLWNEMCVEEKNGSVGKFFWQKESFR